MSDLSQTIIFPQSLLVLKFIKIIVLKNLANFTVKYLCRSLFCKNLQAACNFTNKRLCHRCFFVNFPKILGTTFFYRTPLNNCISTVVAPKLHFHKNQKVRKYYQENAHRTIQKELISENAKITVNFRSPAGICSPASLVCKVGILKTFPSQAPKDKNINHF